MRNTGQSVIDLLVEVEGLSRRSAISFCKDYTPAGRAILLDGLMKKKLERDGQQRLDVGDAVLAKPLTRPKKVAYTLLLPPAMLDAIKQAVELNGLPVSQFIRNAIEKELRGRR